MKRPPPEEPVLAVNIQSLISTSSAAESLTAPPYGPVFCVKVQPYISAEADSPTYIAPALPEAVLFSK